MMSDYQVLETRDVSVRGVKSTVMVILCDVTTRNEAGEVLRRVAREHTKDNAYLLVYAYIEEEAVKWGGYIAKMETGKDRGVAIRFDNNPLLKEALYREMVED